MGAGHLTGGRHDQRRVADRQRVEAQKGNPGPSLRRTVLIPEHERLTSSPSALDAVKTRSDAALEQRPVEAEREPDIAAFDHLVGLFRRARDAADPDAAF